MRPIPNIRAAVPSDVPAIATVLARAFDEDPPMNWIMRKDERRQEALRRFFSMMTEQCLPHGLVFSEAAHAGAALWTPPGKWKSRWYQHLWQLPTWISIVGGRRLPEIIRATDVIAEQHPPRPHYYLFAIGVDPKDQGRGIGKALMRPVLDRCDRERVAAYLEASKPDNVPVYESVGFKAQREIRIGGSGPPIITMLREPLANGPSV